MSRFANPKNGRCPMLKPESYEETEHKVGLLKDVLSSMWAPDLQRAWKCGFDAGRNSVQIVPVVKPPRKARSKSKEKREA
jgi:hypothetical protein